jgi:transposase-like protein
MINEKPNKGKGGRKNTHSDSFKVQVALEYLSGSYSYPQVGKKYGISESTVCWFVSWYRKNQDFVMPEEPLAADQAPLSPQEIKALEKKLAMAEMKVAALEKVIAIANEEYGTDLKKKAATK